MKEHPRRRSDETAPREDAVPAAEDPVTAPAPRVVADRYELLEVLARGGFAVSHRARDLRTGEDRVVKEVLYRKIEDPKVLELLEREARVLAHLAHPRIPRFVEFFSERVSDETRLYLVQGFVPGQSLAQIAQAGRHFTEREVVGLGLQVARILAYLHELRPPIVHRDVKPGNVVLDPDGEAWLVDFGAVRDRILNEIRTEGEGPTIVGTYGYMPFEQFQGRALPASDVFALGMTLVFLLSHKEPHEIEAPGGRLDLEPHVRASPELLRVVRRMIEPRPEDRYASAAEMCADLEALAEAPPTRTRARGAARPAPRRAVAFGLAAAVLAGLVGLAVVLRSKPPSTTTVSRPAAAAPAAPAAAAKPAPGPALPGNLQVLGFSVAGSLSYDGQPLEAITNQPARFWLRHETRGEVQPGIVSYRNGRFVVGALPQGRIGAQITVDLDPTNPGSFPGDLYRFATLEVEARKQEPRDIDLYKVIHLRSPQDNGRPLPGWGEDCAQMFVADEARFEWAPLAQGVTYEYAVERIECPYRSRETPFRGATQGTEITLPLRPSAPNEFYLFRLHAKRGDRTIGLITTHGMRGGLGWDYRFRIR